MVEYSAPNTNKPLHLGHLRNNLLGASIAAILGFHGHEVTRVNLVNDRGVHICKSMLAYERWGEGTDPERSKEKGDHLVGRFYVLFDRRFSEEYAAWQQTGPARERLAAWLESKAGQQAKKAADKGKGAAPEKVFFAKKKDDYFNTESALGAEVREMLRRWEGGDPEVRGLWRRMTDWVLSGFDQTSARMGVGFDHVQYESETYKLGKEIVEEGLEKGVLRRLDDGAVVCDLQQVGLKGEKVLLRSDGTSVYMTQDLGTALERFDRFKIDQLVYVVGDEQIYHFDVLFRVLGLLRPGLTDACHHLAYGMIRLPEGRMKSREGTVVDADDLMDEMHRLAAAETQARADEGKAHTEDLTPEEREFRAERIGMAAIKYYLLKFTPKKSFEYDPKESIDFLGQTGPYCLFNYARTRSLLRRAGGAPAFDAQTARRLTSDRELEVVRLLMAFPDVVARAASSLDPSRVAEYLFELCKSFAFIFTDKANHPIVTCEDEQLRGARLMMVEAVGNTLRAGLGLLGIETLEEM
jgi:arginyl-tRNA synthetase